MQRCRKYLVFILLVLLSSVVYINTIDNGFVYDDVNVVEQNPRIGNWANAKHLFDQKYFKIVGKGKQLAFGEASYRPVVTLTYFLDASFWKFLPTGYHLSNLLIHILNVILFYFVSLFLFDSKLKAFFSASVFAIHPIGSESVNAISFREDLLVALFCMMAFLTIKRQSLRPIFYSFLHAIFYLFALFSKESAIMYPILLGLVFYLKKISFKQNVRIFFLLGVVSCFYLFVRFYLFVNPSVDLLVYPGGSLLTNIYTMVTVFVGYIKKILLPINLLADYEVAFKKSFFDYSVLGSVLFLSVSFIVSLRFFLKNRSVIAFGYLFFSLSLLPVSNFIKISNIAAERYLYFPFIGMALLFGEFFAEILKRNKKIFLAIFVLLILFFSSITLTRNADWKDSLTLWKATLKVEPSSSRALSNLATHYFERQKYRLAIKYYLKSLFLRDSAQDRYNLANAYNAIGDLKKAEQEYKNAIKIDPTHSEIHNNLALLLIKMRKFDEAENEFKKVLLYANQSDRDIYENFGLLYDAKGEYAKAIEYYEKTISINPDKPTVYNKLAVSYIKSGKTEKGKEMLELSAVRFPHNPIFYKNLAVLSNKQGNTEKEIFYLKKAYSLQPHDSLVLTDLIRAYRKQGDNKKALFYINKLKNMENR